MRFAEVDRETWPDLVKLFEARGGPSYCWCMAFRATPEEVKRGDRRSRKAQLERRVDAGVPVGILGYEGDEPVAWCSIAPRETFRPLGGPEARPKERVWSITCFFVARPARRPGVTGELIAAAAKVARTHGATTLEAYPVDPDSPSYRHMGKVPAFEKAGFVEVGRAGTRRHVMRRALRGAAARAPRARSRPRSRRA